MSDTSPWQSPSGSTPPTPPQPPLGGHPLPPPPPPGYAGPPPGWTPPPKPGLIPLAPTTLGVILGASFRVLRRNPRPVVGFSLIIHAILALISIGVTALFTLNALGKYFDVVQSYGTTGQLSQSAALAAGSSLLVASASTLITSVFTYGGQAVLQGIIAMEVSRGTVGEKLPLSALWARSRGRIGVLLGWAGAVILATLLAFAIVAGGVALLFAFGGTAGAIVGAILAFLAAIGSGVIGVWLWTKLSLVPSALVIERLTLRAAMRRSWSLVKGFFWRTFGIQILVVLMVAVAASIIETPVTIAVEVITSLSNPTGLVQSTAAIGSVFGATEIVGTIVGALVATVTAVITTATTALLYIDLRIRKEGLDLALMRFVDARAAGQTDVPDPYLTDASIAPDPAASASQTL